MRFSRDLSAGCFMRCQVIIQSLSRGPQESMIPLAFSCGRPSGRNPFSPSRNSLVTASGQRELLGRGFFVLAGRPPTYTCRVEGSSFPTRSMTMRCPYCGASELLRSRAPDPLHMWVLRPFLVPVRCWRCLRRFHRFRLLWMLSPMSRKPEDLAKQKAPPTIADGARE